MTIQWKRNGAGQLESTDGRFWLINQSHYTGKPSTTWNILILDHAGRWHCDDAVETLRAAKAACEGRTEVAR